jgi:hypothetical protein
MLRSRILAFVLILGGCARNYEPNTPRSARVDGASLSATAFVHAPGPAVYPPVGAVAVQAPYRVERDVTLAKPRLAPSSTAPCSGGGVAATTTLWGDDVPAVPANSVEPPAEQTGTLIALFRRDRVDRAGLLRVPTALDVPVIKDRAQTGCLRVPLVEHPDEPEWSQAPIFSFGYGVDIAIPFRSIYAADAVSMFAIRMGPWVGPFRLRTVLGIGGGVEKSVNANLISYALRTGLLVDVLALHAGRFGVGVAAGYDSMALVLSPNIDQLSHAGAGYQGLIYGPRAGLSFALLPQTPPGPAFVARPDAASATLEVFAGALSSHDYDRATPAIWLTFAVDGGL